MIRYAWPAVLLLGALPSLQEPVQTTRAMVIAQQPAEQAGLQILKQGGNAVDAAVAMGFALNATYPYAGAIGGGGFMLVRFADGRSTFIDFRERAPEAATRTMYLDADGRPTRDSIEGWRSSGVPGTVRGLAMAHAKFGRLKWSTTLAPAIELAAKGFPVSAALAESLRTSPLLSADPESRRIFQRNGAFLRAGERLVQPELARTLTRLSRGGAREFYNGETAAMLAAEMTRHGGLITRSDLDHYTAVERTPLVGRYRNYTVITAPPPSSGGTGLLQMLGMLDGSGYDKAGAGSAATLHYLAEVMRRFYADRSQYLGDPDFAKIPVEGLLAPDYVAARRASIDPDRASSSSELGPGRPAGGESSETTHFQVVDAQGNAVAVTYTLNGGFGNGITVPGLGFLLNNEMDDFAAKPGEANMFGLVQGEANAIQPGKRPLSTMAPTIVLRDGALFMVVGSPGGSHIATAILQVLLNVLDFGMDAQQAVDAPRIHHQWQPDTLFAEPGFAEESLSQLKGRGHRVSPEPGAAPAAVEAIVIKDGRLFGGADQRRTGHAAGY